MLNLLEDEKLSEAELTRVRELLKEDAKHHSLAMMAVLRRAMLTLDRRFGFDGRVFWLRFDEVFELNGLNAVHPAVLIRSLLRP